jgi:hypothetical protein
MKPGKSIQYTVIAAALLAFACTKSDNVVTNTGNNSSPAAVENYSSLPYESPTLLPDESGVDLIKEQPVDEPQELQAEEGPDRICIWDLANYFESWYNQASSLGQKDVDECKRLRIRSNGNTVLEVRLRGNCNLEIELNLDYTEVDTSINVCE